MTTSAVVDREFVERFNRDYTAAWNAHDPDAIVEFLTEDIVYYDPGLPETVRGREAVRTFAQQTFTAFPDLFAEEREPPHPAADQPVVLAPWRLRGTMTGPWELMGLAPTGARVDFSGVDVWYFRGEQMCRYETFYDTLDVARQIGLLPPAGGRQDRALARLQHVQARFQRRANRDVPPLKP